MKDKTIAGQQIFPMMDYSFQGLTKREYFASSASIQNEVADMLKKPDVDYLSLITGINQPDNKDAAMWAKYWFDVEASLKVIKSDALIEALNRL